MDQGVFAVGAATLPQLLDQRRPESDAPFLGCRDGRVLTYDDLDEWVARIIGAVRSCGVVSGDRVAVQVDKSPTAVALHVALLRVGAVQLPLNPAYTDVEVRALLDDAEPCLVIRDPARDRLDGPWQTLTLDVEGAGSLADAAAGPAPPVAESSLTADSPAALLYTSGTTGRPKGALLTHGNLVHNATTLVDAWGFRRGDVLLHVLPLFHTHGLFVATHCVLASGSSMVLLPRFEIDDVVRALPDCTVVMGVPTHYERMLSDPRFDQVATRNVRVFISGSAPMTVGLHERFATRTGQVVLERYGMTETSMLTSNPLHGVRRPGSVGPALPGVEVRAVDDDDRSVGAHAVGGVQVRGPNVFAGYWRRPDLQATEFTPDGWFRTGDLGRFDDDGYLELVGRSKDLVISGGMNVHPKEVEAVLDALDGVQESAVVGVPDADLGEAVVAVVRAEPGVVLDEAVLRDAARLRLAGFKVPKRVHVVNDLPRNAMGKVEKAQIRADLARSKP